jgi:hypothetical protein
MVKPSPRGLGAQQDSSQTQSAAIHLAKRSEQQKNSGVVVGVLNSDWGVQWIPMPTGILNGVLEGVDEQYVRIRLYHSSDGSSELGLLRVTDFSKDQYFTLMGAEADKKPISIKIMGNRISSVEAVSPYRIIASSADKQISLIMSDHKGWDGLQEKEATGRLGDGFLVIIGQDGTFNYSPVTHSTLGIKRSDLQGAPLIAEFLDIAGNRDELVFAKGINGPQEGNESFFWAFDQTNHTPITEIRDHMVVRKKIKIQSELGKYLSDKVQKEASKRVMLEDFDALPKEFLVGGFKENYKESYLTALLVDKRGVVPQLRNEMFATQQELCMEVQGDVLRIHAPKVKQFSEGTWRNVQESRFVLDPNGFLARWGLHGIYDFEEGTEMAKSNGCEALYIPVHHRFAKGFIETWETAKRRNDYVVYDPASGHTEIRYRPIKIVNEHDGNQFDLEELEGLSPQLYTELNQVRGRTAFYLNVPPDSLRFSSSVANEVTTSLYEIKEEAEASGQSLVFQKIPNQNEIYLRALEPRMKLRGGKWEPFAKEQRAIFDASGHKIHTLQLGQGYVEMSEETKGPFNRRGVCIVLEDALRLENPVSYYFPKQVRKDEEVQKLFHSSVTKLRGIIFSFENGSLAVKSLRTHYWADEVPKKKENTEAQPLNNTREVRRQSTGGEKVNPVLAKLAATKGARVLASWRNQSEQPHENSMSRASKMR